MARSALDFDKLQRSSLIMLVTCAALVVLIYGKGLLVPIIIAGMLTGLMTAAINRLEELGLPTWLATACAVGAGVVVLFFFGMIFRDQTDMLAEVWPQYIKRIDGIQADLREWTGAEFADRIAGSIAKMDVTGQIAGFAGTAGGFLSNVGLVLIYTGFLLAERGTLAPKMGRLVPDAKRRAELMDVFGSVGSGIRRYLLIKTKVSLLTGGVCYVILKLYGVHLAELWGLLIFLLNFIPTIGSIIAAIIPSVMSLLQFDTLWPFVQITVLMCAVQFTVGNVIEPRFMGRTLNLSPFVVIVSLTLWSTIWGIEGAFLSVPITASMVIICRNIATLRWVAVLLSVDGRPEAQEEPVESHFHLSWPFGKNDAGSEELKALRKELESIKEERKKSAGKARPAASTKRRRKPAKQK